MCQCNFTYHNGWPAGFVFGACKPQFAALLWAFKSKEMIMRKGSLYFREGVSGVVENLDLGARCYVSTPAGPLIACGILGK